MVDYNRYQEIKDEIFVKAQRVWNDRGFDSSARNSMGIRLSQGERTEFEMDIRDSNIRHPHFGEVVLTFKLGWENERKVDEPVRARTFKIDPQNYNETDALCRIERYVDKLIKDTEARVLEKSRKEQARDAVRKQRLEAIRKGIEGYENVEYDEDKDKIIYRGLELALSTWHDGLGFRVQLGKYRTFNVPLDKVIAIMDMVAD